MSLGNLVCVRHISMCRPAFSNNSRTSFSGRVTEWSSSSSSTLPLDHMAESRLTKKLLWVAACIKFKSWPGLFCKHFCIVAACWVLEPKSLSFFEKELEFFFKKLEFWHFFNFLEGNLFKIYQTLIFSARFAQILGILKFMMAISLPVHWVFWVESEIATGSFNFGPKA